ncbi:MAG: trypsin-like peptidase domain-containing protein [Herpetosiphon sp.]
MPDAQGFTTVIRDVAKRVKPAVVQITNLRQVQADQVSHPFTVPAGTGSGVIYDDQGHILTNNHVVQGAEQLQVSLPSGESYPAKLIGTDPQTDLAVVQVQTSNLPVAQLGDSRQLQSGDWVVAIGNALALEGGPTVSQGVVSALNRTVQEPGQNGAAGPFLFDMIQTDAPINPGNSGGALINLQGQVVGINTLVAGQAEPGVQAQGIGFAIGIDTAKPIADELVKNGHIVHPYLGIRYSAMNPAIAAQLNLKLKEGVVVGAVEPNSPASQAGIIPKDVITAADDQPLKGESALSYALNKHQPGDKVVLTVLRNGQSTKLDVTLGTRPTA